MNNKPVTDWTPDDFIQHEANLDHYERTLQGMARLGKEHVNAELYNATDSAVLTHRARRQKYFDHHMIKAVL